MLLSVSNCNEIVDIQIDLFFEHFKDFLLLDDQTDIFSFLSANLYSCISSTTVYEKDISIINPTYMNKSDVSLAGFKEWALNLSCSSCFG